jgi:hypothetical protein
MPSSYTARNRLTKQATGEGTNIWGDVQNAGVFDLADFAMDGWTTKALTGNYTLTSANGTADEARARCLKFTGTGSYTVTLPSVEKTYMVWSALTGNLTLTTGSGSTVTIESGDLTTVICDGTNVRQLMIGGLSFKQYADAAALSASGSLPASAGNEGKALFVRSGSWVPSQVVSTDLSDYATQIVGKQQLWIPASAMIARNTNGAAVGLSELTTNKVMLSTLDFDPSTVEYAQFQVAMPKSWNEGTVTFQPIWSHGATTTNFKVSWGLQGMALSNDDPMDAAFGTAQYSNDTGGTTDDIYIGDESAAVTIGGTPAAQDVVVFQVLRKADDGTNDTLAIDAKLIGVRLTITTDAGSDS